MSILVACCVGLTLLAQPLEEDVTYTMDSRNFGLPIYIKEEKRDTIAQLILYSSSDKGCTWQEVTTVPPTQGHFIFSAPKDGIYWFVVQVISKDGTKRPADVAEAEPNLKVAVKTGSKKTRKHGDEIDPEVEIAQLREEVKKLEKRIAELEKMKKKKP